jgi:RNA polymerase sigma factor (sigma-70 family)
MTLSGPADDPFHGAAEPHRDPARFDAVVEAAGPDSCIVVLEGWMGAAVRGWCQAEDVWQETLAVAWRDRGQHTWKGVRAWRGWVLGIARNRVTDIARRAAAEKRGGGVRHALFSDLEGGGSGERRLSDFLPPGSSTPSRIASAKERSLRMQAALEGLSAEQRDVLRLYLFEERTMEDVAATLGISLSAAWGRFRRGSEAYAASLRDLDSRAGAAGA